MSAPRWHPGWRIGHRRWDWLRTVRCLLAGHRWEVNYRETQRVCRQCHTAQDRVIRPAPPHVMRRHGRVAQHSETCWCREQRGPNDRVWVSEHHRDCAECRTAAHAIAPGSCRICGGPLSKVGTSRCYEAHGTGGAS